MQWGVQGSWGVAWQEKQCDLRGPPPYVPALFCPGPVQGSAVGIWLSHTLLTSLTAGSGRPGKAGRRGGSLPAARVQGAS